MTYTATQFPMDTENKTHKPDPFHGAAAQDGFGEAFFNDLVNFDGPPWDVGDSDSSSGPASLPNPDSFMFTPTTSSFNVSFLSEAPTSPSVSPEIGCTDLFSQAGHAECDQENGIFLLEQGAGGQGQQAFKDEQPASVQVVHPPPPAINVPMRDVMFPVIPDTELLELENITLQTQPRPLSHSSPASPTIMRQSNDPFDVFSATITAPASQPSEMPAVENTNAEGQRGRVAESRASFRARSTSGLSTQRPDAGSSFVKGSVDNPFGNRNSAPMPPPREPKVFHRQKAPSPLMGIGGNGTPYLGVSEAISRTPSPHMLDDMSWTVPSFPMPFPCVEKQDTCWGLQSELLENEPLVRSSAAVQDSTLNLARLTDGFEFLGYEDYSHNPTSSDYLMPSVAIESSRSRPRSQTTGMMNLSYSPMLSQSTSLPSTPAQRPARTPSFSSRQMTPMSSPLRKVHTIRGASTSPSPARGRLRVNEPGVARSASTAGDSSVRKRRSSSRREVRKPLAADGAGGFVNFTASDCQTLMMGVAPSGSSKTKAKREREGQERRMRLELAARKAVEAAGGDVEMLLAGEAGGLMHL